MNEQTIDILNRYAKKNGAKRDIVDILAVDFELKHGAIVDERGVEDLREVLVDDYGFSYYHDSEHGHWYIASHPSLLQLVERRHTNKERKQLANGLFCSYDVHSVVSHIQEETLSREQVIQISDSEFKEFLASENCYYPYSPSPIRLDTFFDRAEKRYHLAKIVEPLFEFEFPEAEEKAEVKV